MTSMRMVLQTTVALLLVVCWTVVTSTSSRKTTRTIKSFFGAFTSSSLLILTPIQLAIPIPSHVTSIYPISQRTLAPLVLAANAKSSDTAALQRFEQAYRELQTLNDNWDNIVKDQGDNVRRKLGLVDAINTKSSLWHILHILYIYTYVCKYRHSVCTTEMSVPLVFFLYIHTKVHTG